MPEVEREGERKDERIRIDKWLWHARFFKTRTLAAGFCRSGKIRLNGVHVKKTSQNVGPGDILTFSKITETFVVKIIACGTRRGPAVEAQGLYEDLSPKPSKDENDNAQKKKHFVKREKGLGRPTKKDRRATDQLKKF